MHPANQLFLSVYVDDFKMAGKTENLAPMWKELNKRIELDPPVPLNGTTYLVCTQYETEPSSLDVAWCMQMYHDLTNSTFSNTTVLKHDDQSADTTVSLEGVRAYHHEVTGHSLVC